MKALAIVLALLLSTSAQAAPRHGIAMHGEPLLPRSRGRPASGWPSECFHAPRYEKAVSDFYFANAEHNSPCIA